MEAREGVALCSPPVQQLQEHLPTAELSVGRRLEPVCSKERQATDRSLASLDSLQIVNDLALELKKLKKVRKKMQRKSQALKKLKKVLKKMQGKSQASSRRKHHASHQVSSK